ncbi:hypothetical protein AB0O28_01235 [Microbispora sp. NPDC088329]
MDVTEPAPREECPAAGQPAVAGISIRLLDKTEVAHAYCGISNS